MAHFEESDLADREKLALRYAEHLILDPGAVTDAFFEELRRALSEGEIVEIGFTVLMYNGLHRFNTALDLDPMDGDNLVILEAVHPPAPRA